ncbi:unnamed protein product [Effrenium voratum]|nr:unnamed protein product [Effrenium voratum]
MQLPVGLAVAGRWWALGIAADAAFAAAALPAEEFSAQQAAQHAVDHHWMRLEEEYRKQKVQWGTGHELQPKLDLVFASKEEEGVVELVEAAAALPLMENLRSALHGLCLAMHRAQALHGRFACFRHCCDVSRLALVFETPRQLISAAKRLMEKREVLWLENEFANPSCDGCRQVSLGLRLAESQVTELRLLLRPLLAAKKLQRQRLEDALEEVKEVNRRKATKRRFTRRLWKRPHLGMLQVKSKHFSRSPEWQRCLLDQSRENWQGNL